MSFLKMVGRITCVSDHLGLSTTEHVTGLCVCVKTIGHCQELNFDKQDAARLHAHFSPVLVGYSKEVHYTSYVVVEQARQLQ